MMFPKVPGTNNTPVPSTPFKLLVREVPDTPETIYATITGLGTGWKIEHERIG